MSWVPYAAHSVALVSDPSHTLDIFFNRIPSCWDISSFYVYITTLSNLFNSINNMKPVYYLDLSRVPLRRTVDDVASQGTSFDYSLAIVSSANGT